MVHLNAVLIALLASIVISAFTIVVTEKMVMCVIVSGALSAVCAFVFVIIGAPDVALAEIAIGSTLSTIIYLVALQKYRAFRVLYTLEPGTSDVEDAEKLLSKLENLLKGQDFEPEIIASEEDFEKMVSDHSCDMIVSFLSSEVVIYMQRDSRYAHVIEAELSKTEFRRKILLKEVPVELSSNYGSESA